MSEHKCCCGCKDEKIEKLNAIIEKNKTKRGGLIATMHEAQELYGYLPMNVQKAISEGLNVPMSEVYGVATFYSRFSLEPKGEYKISVCLGTACYVKGADKIMDKLKEKLGIEAGKCTEDRKFSLDATRCIGACGLAPVMTVNEDVYGKVTPDMIEGILKKYQDNK